jgi:hypothetical protein
VFADGEHRPDRLGAKENVAGLVLERRRPRRCCPPRILFPLRRSLAVKPAEIGVMVRIHRRHCDCPFKRHLRTSPALLTLVRAPAGSRRQLSRPGQSREGAVVTRIAVDRLLIEPHRLDRIGSAYFIPRPA